MNFDQLVDRLTSLFDVNQARAVDVANERLSRMMVEARAIRKMVTLATTVSGTSSYALDPSIAGVLKAKAVYSTGQVNYEGVATIEELWDIDATLAQADSSAAYFVVEPDTDDSQTTANLRLFPTPSETGVTVTGLAIVRPATFTYGGASALPLDVNLHEYLLAGCKAELEDEEDRQDQSAKFEAVFGQGVAKLAAAVTLRGKGSAPHRMRFAGYDYGNSRIFWPWPSSP